MSFPRMSAQLLFSHLETDVGMRAVQTIERDSYGYLWVGQNGGGMLRYDGYEFKDYKKADDGGGPIGSFIFCIFEDSKRRLWVATRSGLSRYDRQTDSFFHYLNEPDNPRSLGSSVLEQVFETNDGGIWVVARNSLNRYDEQDDVFVPFVLDDSVLGREVFQHANELDENHLWIVGSRSRMWKLDRNSGEYESYEVFPDERRAHRKICRDSLGNYWIYSLGGGLSQFFPESMTTEKIPVSKDGRGISGLTVRGVVEHEPGTLMILVDQGGLNYLDVETRDVRYQSFVDGSGNGLSSDGVVSVNIDDEGIVWIGHSRTGIDYYNPMSRSFRTVSRQSRSGTGSLLHEVVGCLLEGENGDILVGTDGGGIYLFEPDNGRVSKLELGLESGVIRQMARVGQSVWVATWDGGIYVLVEEEGQYRVDRNQTRKFERWANESIWDLDIDSENRIWVSTRPGQLHCLNLEGDELFRIEHSSEILIRNNVNLMEVRPGEILFGGQSSLYRYDSAANSVIAFADIELALAAVYDPGSESYYVGTFENGVYHLNEAGEILAIYDESNGLPNQDIRGLLLADENEVWASSEEGLFRIEMDTQLISSFGKEDGLQGNQYFTDSAFAAEDGTLYFGGTTGFSSFHPQRLSRNTRPPHVYIDRIMLFGEELNHREENSLIDVHPHALDRLELNWDQNHLAFDFTGISLSSPQKNLYAYKLEGFEDDWVMTNASRRRATYTNLDPGSYVFTVKASNSDGVWNEEGASIAVEILPPFWNTYWFYGVALTVLGIGAYSFVRARERLLRQEGDRLSELVKEKTAAMLDYQEQLEAHKDVLEDVVEKRTKELVTARDKAEESDRLKSQFLANLSHEIRTPLNAITGLSSLMDDDNLEKEVRRNYSEIITESSDSLLNLIDDILDFSLIEADQLKIAPSAFSLNEFMENVFSAFAIRMSDENVDLRLRNEVSEEDLLFVGDRSRIKQVLDNLLTNALKFTRSGFVVLAARRIDKTIEFHVEDTGPGIPREELELIFETFVKRQVDDAAARRGVGLGLAISKRLARLMDGDLTVESEVGKGSVFTLTLPLRLEEHSTNRSEQKDSVVGGSGKRVLVIEDEPTNYRYLQASLRKIGIETDWAKDGLEGLEALEGGESYELVLLDIKMPGIDGYETLARIRQLDSSVPVVAQTAYAMKSDESKIRNAGFDSYLAKPIRFEDLIELVERTLGLAR